MQRVTSRQNERLREVARLIASSRERRKSGRCVLEGAHLIDVYTARVGAPETLVVVDDRLDDPAIAQADRARARRRALVALPRTLFADLATLPPDVGALAVVTAPRAAPARTGPVLPAARGRAGSRQRRLDDSHRRRCRRRPGRAVAALRVRLVAQGAARRAGRAFPDDARRGRGSRRVDRRVSRCGRTSSWRPWSTARRSFTQPTCADASRWRSAAKGPACRKRCWRTATGA